MTGDPGGIDGSKPSRCRPRFHHDYAPSQTIPNFDSLIPPLTNNYLDRFSPSKN